MAENRPSIRAFAHPGLSGTKAQDDFQSQINDVRTALVSKTVFDKAAKVWYDPAQLTAGTTRKVLFNRATLNGYSQQHHY